MNRVRKFIFAGLASVVLFIAGVYGYYLWEQSGALFRLKTFDRDKWLSGKIHSHTGCKKPGAYMANDIVTRVIKPGMSRNEVVALLGGPNPGEIEKIEYDLGLCLSEDGSSIIIYFDPDGRVTRAEIR